LTKPTIKRFAVALLIMSCALGCSKKGGDADDESKPATAAVPDVTVVKVKRASLVLDLAVSGNVAALPNEDAKIAALVSGRIARVLVLEGDRVTVGQKLAELDSSQYRDQVKQAEAAVQQAKANVENAVLAAKRLGAERIIAVGHHADRLDKARAFGATDVVSGQGPEAAAKVLELTRGGADHVLECVGAASSMDLAIQVTRPGGTIGYVGVPHGVAEKGLDVMTLFFGNRTLRGGPAPVRAYMKELMEDVLAGTLDPSPVFDMTVDLAGVPAGYAAMDERRALKVMVKL